MRKLFIGILVSLLSVASIPNIAYSWNNIGHRVSASIAWHQLTPKTKASIVAFARNEEAFSFCATWPDQIKSEGMDLFNSWHYINLFNNLDPSHLPTPAMDRENVVWIIKKAQAGLQNRHAKKWHGFYLRFLIHAVGDVHQPLHCHSRVSQQFPKGDRGGNDYSVVFNGEATSLHTLWDNGFGMLLSDAENKAGQEKDIAALVKTIETQYPVSALRTALTVEDPAIWAEAGFKIALKEGYVCPVGGVVTEQTQQQAQQIIKQQLALSGYRMAAMLNDIFK